MNDDKVQSGDAKQFDRIMRRVFFISISGLLVIELIIGVCVGFTPTMIGLVMLKVFLIAFMSWCYSRRGWWT